MAEKKKPVQVAVIGGGPAGYAAAFRAADIGLEVTLIDPEKNPGGVCLYRGCIPSKALLHAARLIHDAEDAGELGISFTKPKVNLNKLRSWKDDVVERLTGGVGQLTARRKITHVRGTARFITSNTVIVKEGENEERTMSFDYLIVATGSRPTIIEKLAVDSPRLLDSTSALDLEDVPGTLLVIGGGYIGLELGTVYAALGSRVSVVEMTSGLLPGVDRDLVSVLSKRLEKLFESIMLETTVTELKVQKNGIKASLEGKEAKTKAKIYDKVLMAVGRRPNSEDIGLENTKAEIDDRGFIKVNEKRQTADQTIYAIGDVAGEPMLAHKGTHEGIVAAEAIAGKKTAFEPNAIPAVVFTDPEIAWCGLTQTEAREKNMDVDTVRFPWGASGRALTLGRTDGVTKLIVDKESKRVLGVGIAGPGAGELIAEGVLAVEMAAQASDLALTIHAHPTLSETIMEAADMIYGPATHFYARKK
jgi:dihydrolipoamide dehydrogenase